MSKFWNLCNFGLLTVSVEKLERPNVSCTRSTRFFDLFFERNFVSKAKGISETNSYHLGYKRVYTNLSPKMLRTTIYVCGGILSLLGQWTCWTINKCSTVHVRWRSLSIRARQIAYIMWIGRPIYEQIKYLKIVCKHGNSDVCVTRSYVESVRPVRRKSFSVSAGGPWTTRGIRKRNVHLPLVCKYRKREKSRLLTPRKHGVIS